MTEVLALPKLYDDVTALVLAADPTVHVAFGWREPTKQLEAVPRRLIWVPGDQGSGLGREAPAKFPGRIPRPLGTLLELFQVHVQAYDAADRENERKAYTATRLLFDVWRSALHRSAPGRYIVESVRWVTDKIERRHGAALVATCTIQAMLPDLEEAADTLKLLVDANVTAVMPGIVDTIEIRDAAEQEPSEEPPP